MAVVGKEANQTPVLTLKEQKELERLRAQDQREIKSPKKKVQGKEKLMAEMTALLVLRKSSGPSVWRTQKVDQRRAPVECNRT